MNLSIEKQLDKYVRAVSLKDAKAPNWLNPGTTDFAAFEQIEGVVLSHDLRSFWCRFNGMNIPEGTLLQFAWLDGMFYFFSVEDSASDYQVTVDLRVQDEHFASFWRKGLIPIGSPGDGSRILVDCNKNSQTLGSVYELSHGIGISRIAGSLSRYFETLNVCLSQNAISVTKEGAIVLNFDAFRRIGGRMNPDCDHYDNE